MYSFALVLLFVASPANAGFLQGAMPPAFGTYDLLKKDVILTPNLSTSLIYPKNPPPYLNTDCGATPKNDPELVYFSYKGMLMKDVPCSVAFETQDKLLAGAACDLAAEINQSGQTLFDLCPQTFCELCNREKESKAMEAPIDQAMESKVSEPMTLDEVSKIYEDAAALAENSLPAPEEINIESTSLVPPGLDDLADESLGHLEAPVSKEVEVLHSEGKEL